MLSWWRQQPFLGDEGETACATGAREPRAADEGIPRPVELVAPDELGVTFIGHSSFLLQIGGRRC